MSTDTTDISFLSPDLQRQTEYAERMTTAGFDFSAVVMGAVVKGMRDLGYKSMATALDELIDNAVQAEASDVHVYVGEEAKPSFVAVIDNGHGMSPTMLRLSAVWGAGHHQDEEELTGFGKYGYGLPSACVSMGKRFTTYSKLAGSAWHKVGVDLQKIEEGDYGHGQPVQVEQAEPTELPTFLSGYLRKHFGKDLEHGTVVVIDKLDRLTWKTKTAISRHLMEHFGLIYRNFSRTSKVWVQGKKVDVLDPLFLTPGARYFDLDGDTTKAEALPGGVIDVKDQEARNVVGQVRVRYSSMPPWFARSAEDRLKTKGGKANPRFNVLDDNNGIIVCRAGRQIDVVRSKRDTELGIKFAVNNDDRYWGVELDFDPALDDEFSITTSKQQVNLSDRMWQLLKENNVMAAIEDLRRRYDAATAKLREEQRRRWDGPKPAERAMEEADRFLPKPAPTRAAKGKARMVDEAKQRSKTSGVKPEEILPTVEKEAGKQRYKVMSADVSPTAAFYEPDQLGGQTRVILNRHHDFFTHIYNGPSGTSASREAFDLLLLTLAEAENNSDGDRKLFYVNERIAWSQRLAVASDRLDQIIGEDSPRDDEAEVA